MSSIFTSVLSCLCFIFVFVNPLGAAWQKPTSLVYNAGGGLDSTRPQVAVDANGNAIAVWESDNGTNTTIRAATLPFNATNWSTSTLVYDAGGGLNSTQPQVAVDPNGNAIAVWYSNNGTNTTIRAATLPFNAANWSASTLVYDAGGGLNSFDPQVAVDANGNAVAVWYSKESLIFST
ncbi:hypothetical protein N9Y92_03010 [Chlamydiales bacterium]|nr:hypothetical protein [Chlamydiales bacterium]